MSNSNSSTNTNIAAQKLTPTQEQQDIIDAFKHTRVLKVNAVAGSGKSSTLRMLAEHYNQDSLLIAFNKSIAEEAAARFPTNVKCRTINSIAYQTHGVHLKHKMNTNNYNLRYLKDIVEELKLTDYALAEPAISANTVAALARDALERYSFSNRKEISVFDMHYKDFKELAKNHKFDDKHLAKCVIRVAKALWNERVNPLRPAYCTHDTYMKLWSLSNPKLNYDIVYVDEAQDINPCVLSVLENQQCKILYCGDQHQAIYGWRGAVNAMKSIVAPTMNLSQSWRYGEAVADVAELVLEKYDVTVKGNPAISSVVTKVNRNKPYTMIFRTNAAMFEEAASLVMQGKEVFVETEVSDFVRQLESVIALKQGKKPFHDSISRFSTWGDLVDFSEESQEIKRLVNMSARSDVSKLIGNLKKVITPKTLHKLKHKPAIMLTTAHKSKGLEWDSVIVADDFPFGKEDALSMPEQESNLLYVACTRAKHNLQLPLALYKLYNTL